MIGPQLACLALAVYFEARGEPLAGQVAVAQTIVERVQDDRWPGTVCAVVYQPRHFEFYWDGKPETVRDNWAWDRAMRVADAVASGVRNETCAGATHYHATYVRPWWVDLVQPVCVVGNHVFYREEP